MLLFIHHYVIMKSFYLDFKFIITGSTDVNAVMESVFVYKAECLFLSVNLSVNMEQCVQIDINSVFSFPRRHLVCLMWCLRYKYHGMVPMVLVKIHG